MAEEELFAARRLETHVLRVPLRASFAAYMVLTSAQPAEEPPPAAPRSASLVVPALAPPRAANAAYVGSRNTLALPDTSAPQTVYEPQLSQPQRGPLSAAPLAYWLPSRAIFLEDEPHTQALLWPRRAPGWPRAAAGTYGISVGFVIGDALPLNRELLPRRAPAPPRTAVDAYWRNQSFAVFQEPAPNAVSAPRVARAAGRAAVNAYAIAERFAMPSEPPNTIGIAIPATTPAAPRPASTSYLIAATFSPQSEPTLCPRWLPERAMTIRRAAATAYEFTNRVGLEEPPLGVVQVSAPARQSPYAASSAYLIAACWLTEEFAVETQRGFLDVQPRKPPRSSASSYSVLVTGVLVPVAGGFVGPFYPEAAQIILTGPEAIGIHVAGAEASELSL